PFFGEVPHPFEFMMEAAGLRHIPEISIENIEINSVVSFVPEPENPVDSQAIKILSGGNKIGYVTRALLPQFHQWLKQGRIIRAVVERKNGIPGKPTLYIFVEL